MHKTLIVIAALFLVTKVVALADPIETSPGHYQRECTFKIDPTRAESSANRYKQVYCEFIAVDKNSDGKQHGLYYYSDGIADYLKTIKGKTVTVRWSRRESGALGTDQIGDLNLSEVSNTKKEWSGTFVAN